MIRRINRHMRVTMLATLLAMVVAVLLVVQPAPGPVAASVPDPGAPAASAGPPAPQQQQGDPTNLQVVSESPGQAILTWQPGADSVVEYAYSQKIDGTNSKLMPVDGNASTLTFTGLESGQNYLFIIVGVQIGEGEELQYKFSNVQIVEIAATPAPTLTPAPEPTATPTGPQAVDDYIVWKIGDEVSPAAEAEARETVVAVHDYAAGLGMPRIYGPITIFIYHDLDSLAAEFEATTGRIFESWVGPDFAAGRSMARGKRDFVAINTSAERYQEYSSDRRKEQLVERLFNVYRTALTGIWQGTPRDAVHPEGPTWLIEGSQRFLTYQVIRAPGPESCDPTRVRYGRIRDPMEAPLSEAETRAGFSSIESPYQHSFLAVELLAEQTGQESIIGYFASLRTGVTWPEAFQTNFGMSVAEFYQQFEERRAAGFPEPVRSKSVNGPTSTPGPFDHLLQDPSLPSYLRWDIGSGVEQSEVESAIQGAKLMHEFAQSLGVPDPSEPITITIYKDMEKLACKYSMKTGWDLEKSRKYWENGGAVAGRGNVHIAASTPERLNLMRLMAHELTHAHFQHGLLVGFSERGSGTSPRWLGEGTAMLVTALLIREDYPDVFYQHERSREEEVSSAESTGLQLRDAEVWPPSEGGTVGMDEAGLNIVRCIYSCGYIAAELLASQVGVSKLFDYYKYVEPWMEPWDPIEGEIPSREWRIAYERAYGMTVEEFYELFEEHRAAGFPELEVSK